MPYPLTCSANLPYNGATQSLKTHSQNTQIIGNFRGFICWRSFRELFHVEHSAPVEPTKMFHVEHRNDAPRGTFARAPRQPMRHVEHSRMRHANHVEHSCCHSACDARSTWNIAGRSPDIFGCSTWNIPMCLSKKSHQGATWNIPDLLALQRLHSLCEPRHNVTGLTSRIASIFWSAPGPWPSSVHEPGIVFWVTDNRPSNLECIESRLAAFRLCAHAMVSAIR